jgi:hypothetical protein
MAYSFAHKSYKRPSGAESEASILSGFLRIAEFSGNEAFCCAFTPKAQGIPFDSSDSDLHWSADGKSWNWHETLCRLLKTIKKS